MKICNKKRINFQKLIIDFKNKKRILRINLKQLMNNQEKLHISNTRQ